MESREQRRYDESRRWMRRGMAKCALQIKSGNDMKDAHGQPLSYAKRMAEGHSYSTLNKWIEDRRTFYGIGSSDQQSSIGTRSGRATYVFDKDSGKVVRVA